MNTILFTVGDEWKVYIGLERECVKAGKIKFMLVKVGNNCILCEAQQSLEK